LYLVAISSCFSFVAKSFINANTLQVSGFLGSSNPSLQVTIDIIFFFKDFSSSKIQI
jgi:hypothetical protein